MKTLQQSLPASHYTYENKTSILHQFIAWCNKQEENRLLWVGITLTGHGCVITPITLFVIMTAGNNMLLWPFAMAAIALCLVVNLAALPAKITLPVFFFSLLIDLTIIITCIVAAITI